VASRLQSLATIHVLVPRGIAVHVEFEYAPDVERSSSSARSARPPPPPHGDDDEKKKRTAEKKKREHHSTPILQLYRSR
jgi:hypothetical protein